MSVIGYTGNITQSSATDYLYIRYIANNTANTGTMRSS